VIVDSHATISGVAGTDENTEKEREIVDARHSEKVSR
jgi:hypothetical protein